MAIYWTNGYTVKSGRLDSLFSRFRNIISTTKTLVFSTRRNSTKLNWRPLRAHDDFCVRSCKRIALRCVGLLLPIPQQPSLPSHLLSIWLRALLCGALCRHFVESKRVVCNIGELHLIKQASIMLFYLIFSETFCEYITAGNGSNSMDKQTG